MTAARLPPFARAALAALALVATSACPAKVRDLTKSEQEYLAALRSGVGQNGAALRRALDDLGRIRDNAALSEHELTLSAVARAKLLESLRAPWAAPPDRMQATQRAVVLYHLYDLAQAEQRAFEATQTERAAERARVAEDWAKIEQLLGDALAAQERILKDLDQPADAQVAVVVGTFLTHARAFQAELAKSKDPDLARVAAEADAALGQVEQHKDKLGDVLKLLRSLPEGR